MPTQALERVKQEGWIPTKFVEFVQSIYPEIDAAIEEVNAQRITLYILTANTLEIVTTPLQPQASLNVNVESIPLSKIRTIRTEYEECDLLDPSDHIELQSLKFKVTISFENRQDWVIDLHGVNGLRRVIPDVNHLVGTIKRSI